METGTSQNFYEENDFIPTASMSHDYLQNPHAESVAALLDHPEDKLAEHAGKLDMKFLRFMVSIGALIFYTNLSVAAILISTTLRETTDLKKFNACQLMSGWLIAAGFVGIFSIYPAVLMLKSFGVWATNESPSPESEGEIELRPLPATEIAVNVTPTPQSNLNREEKSAKNSYFFTSSFWICFFTSVLHFCVDLYGVQILVTDSTNRKKGIDSCHDSLKPFIFIYILTWWTVFFFICCFKIGKVIQNKRQLCCEQRN